MERSSKHFAYGRQQPRPQGFVATAMWVLPTMAVMAVIGFFGAQYVANTYLHPSQVQAGRPKPIRVLTPSEAQALAHEESSPVWTEGVQDEDIPKLEPAPSERRAPRRHTRTTHERPTAPEAPTAPPATPTTPAAAPAPPTAAPAPNTPAAETAPAAGAAD